MRALCYLKDVKFYHQDFLCHHHLSHEKKPSQRELQSYKNRAFSRKIDLLPQFFWVEANHRVGAVGSDCSAFQRKSWKETKERHRKMQGRLSEGVREHF